MKKAVYVLVAVVIVLLLAGAISRAFNKERVKAFSQSVSQGGVNVNARDKFGGRTILMMAAFHGQTEAVKKFLKAGADTEARENKYGLTALIIAAFKGHTEAIRELLKAGANKRARSNDGETAFDFWQRRHKDHPDFQEISDLLRP